MDHTMKTLVCQDVTEMGRRAAADGAERIRKALAERGRAGIILATGASQFAVLKALIAEPDINWSRVTAFHLDEYIGLPATHPASFRRYLRERFAELVSLEMFHFIRGDALDLSGELKRIGYHLARHPIDVAFVGIGENAHLAFNDPPADFSTDEPYIAVELDEACRRQQMGEGWFPSLHDVPRRAITMSIRWIMKSNAIICSVPEERKAQAVRDCLEGKVRPEAPASILRWHDDATLYLDPASASLLTAPSSPPAR